jgi:4-hydroxy-4-methyl-2-oxoglutarate aldolase
MPQDIAEALSLFGTSILADAMERLNVQLRNQGFTQPGLQCFDDRSVAIAGFAATARIRTSDPSITGQPFYRHPEWWDEIDRLPRPRIIVIEDIDRPAGIGASIGQVGAAMFGALDCRGAITNGSVRDAGVSSQMGFAMFGAHQSPSHSYAHLVEHSIAVEIFGLKINPGDLLVADRHGVLAVPPGLTERLFTEAEEVRRRKEAFTAYCKSPRFALGELEQKLKELRQ